jgi:hypothetical protein
MSLTMYTATVPTCTRALNNLAAIIEKAAAQAETRKIAPAVLLNSRLFPDMFPLATQIHIANDIAKAAPRGLQARRFRLSRRRSAALPNGSLPRAQPLPISNPETRAIRGRRGQDHHLADRSTTRNMQEHRLPVPPRAAKRVFPRHHGV